jgi:VWFA-related protein
LPISRACCGPDAWRGLLAAVALLALSALPLSASDGQEKEPQFSVRVNLVALDVEVLDREGRPVTGLLRDDFLIQEDGEAREISSFAYVSDRAVSLSVVLDTSAVTPERLSLSKQFISLLAHVLGREDELALYTFDYKDAYREQGFSTDRRTLVETLENIGVTSRRKRTFFKDLMGTAPRMGLCIDMALRAGNQAGRERKALLVVSNRWKGLGQATLEHVRETGWPVFMLSFTGDKEAFATLEQDESTRGDLARESGGRQFSAEGGEMAQICRSIAYALKNHYTITYLTEAADEGEKERRIDVSIRGRDCIIHTRRSYVSDRSR